MHGVDAKVIFNAISLVICRMSDSCPDNSSHVLMALYASGESGCTMLCRRSLTHQQSLIVDIDGGSGLV
jgi:hypothetical protein